MLCQQDPAITAFFDMLTSIDKHLVIKTTKPRAYKARHGAMLARLYAGETPASYVCEPKVDGLRVLITADLSTRTVRFETRNGNPMPSLDHLADEVLDLLAGKAGVWSLDGEAVSGKSFFTSVGALRSDRSADDARVWLFDLPSVAGDYSTRRASLEALFAQSYPSSLLLIPSVSCTPGEAFIRFTSEGFEGAMVKDTAAPYAHGIRSRAWLKVKDADTTDAEIVDVVEGTGKCAGMAGHIVVRCGRRLVSVGTGMDNATRSALLADRSQLIGQTAEVDFQMKTPKGSLRHPVFVRVRGDK
jgi:ATP-dependent DNA ligase